MERCSIPPPPPPFFGKLTQPAMFAPSHLAYSCETYTSAALAEFRIELDYLGTWTDARKAVFESAASRYTATDEKKHRFSASYIHLVVEVM